jgi:hypothetical protein
VIQYLGIYAQNIPSKKIIGGVKGSKNIQPGSAELKKRGQNMIMCNLLCLVPLQKGECF